MKLKAFAAAALAVIALCSMASVEARCHRSSHFSLNLGALFAPAPAPVTYVVDSYPQPVIVQPTPYVAAPAPVYVAPQPIVRQVYVVPQRSAFYHGASFSWNFFR